MWYNVFFDCSVNPCGIPISNVQSLIQLAAALNGAYFAFRAANSEYYNYIDSVVDRLISVIQKASSIDGPQTQQYWPSINDIRNSLAARNRFYRWFNHTMLIVGYSDFIAMCLLLFAATLLSTCAIPNYMIISIFLIGYLPSLIAVVVEIIFRVKFRKIDKSVSDIETAIGRLLTPVEH